MKDVVLTLRIPSALRRQIEKRAAEEGRSLSSAAERLIEAGLQAAGARSAMGTGWATGVVREPAGPAAIPPLGGSFPDALVPELAAFREIRAEMSASLLARTRPDAKRRRR